VRARESPGSANEVIAGFLPEVTLPGQCGRHTTGSSEAYRKMIELEPSRGRHRP